MVKRLNKLFYNIFDGNKCLMIIMCIRKKLFCEEKLKVNGLIYMIVFFYWIYFSLNIIF